MEEATMKSEVRSPKSEGSPKAESRMEQSQNSETQKAKGGIWNSGTQESRKEPSGRSRLAAFIFRLPEFLSSKFHAALSEFLSFGFASFGYRLSAIGYPLSAAALLLALSSTYASATPTATFSGGGLCYTNGDFAAAAQTYAQLAAAQPTPGTFCNLGNAEWRLARTGPAILAWERAVWLAPYHAAARNNLRFARITTQLTAPELAWYEVASTWLPVNAWPWLAVGSLWLAVAVLLVPGLLGWRRREAHQAMAAAAIAVFLLTLPALLGVHTRTKFGVIIDADTALRLTPTTEAQTLMKLPAGEMVRRVRQRGDYLFVRVGSDASGWVLKSQLVGVRP
jgi:hypothetical protein